MKYLLDTGDDGRIVWDWLRHQVGEPFPRVRVTQPGAAPLEHKVRSSDGIISTSTQGLVSGAVWEFLDTKGNVLATLRITGREGEVLTAEVETVQVDTAKALKDCTFGDYPWDRWGKKAKERGVREDLAELGLLVKREAVMHSWPAPLQKECGWSDSGEAMIRLALEHPEKAKKRWDWLLETDGGRGSSDEKTGEWSEFGHDPARDH